MPPAVVSTSTTRNGTRNAARRSSTGYWRCPPRYPICAGASPPISPLGLERDRVLALALHLLDLGYFRAGGEQYAEENNSFGIATLLCERVNLQRTAVEFDYPAKSGVRRTLVIDDPEVVRSVRALLRRPERTNRLLVCRNTSGWTDIHADDLNARFKELVPPGCFRQGPAHLARHGAGGGGVRRRGPPSEQDGGEARRVRGDERGFRSAGQYAPRLPDLPTSTRACSKVTKRVSPSRPARGRADRAMKHSDRQQILERSTTQLIRKVARS